MTVDEWFDLYISLYKDGISKPSSMASIKRIYKLHIKPYIEDKQIQK